MLLSKYRTTVLCMENSESLAMCECSLLYRNDILCGSKTEQQPDYNYFSPKEYKIPFFPPHVSQDVGTKSLWIHNGELDLMAAAKDPGGAGSGPLIGVPQDGICPTLPPTPSPIPLGMENIWGAGDG